MTPDEARIRAERARQILEDDLVKESFNATQDALLRSLRSVKTESEAYKAAIAFQIFELIKGSIESHIENAKVVEFNFRDERKKAFGLF